MNVFTLIKKGALMRDWDRRAYGGGVYRERKEDPSFVHSRFRSKFLTVTLILLAMIFTAGVVAAVFLLFPDYKKPAPADVIVIEGSE